MGFSTEKLEVLATRSILEFFNICIVAVIRQKLVELQGTGIMRSHLEAELVELGLHILDNLRLKHLTLFEDFLHCHTRDYHTGFSFDNACMERATSA